MFYRLLQLISIAAILSLLTACSGPTDTASLEIGPVNEADRIDTVDTVLDEPAVPDRPDSVLKEELTESDQLIAWMEASDSAAAYRKGILPSIARQNEDYARRLLQSRYPYFIIVDKQSMKVILYDRFGREVRCYPMACSKKYGAKHKRRDNRTPEGFFTAEGIYNSTEWLYTDDDGNTSQKKGQFGPRYIRLKTDVTSQVGIHGTCAPGSLGRRASHGCIRIHNDNILELVTYARAGMPIIVSPSDRDQQVNREEDFEIPQIKVGKPTASNAHAEKLKEEEKAKADSIAAAKKLEKEKPKAEERPAETDSHTVTIETAEADTTFFD